jgi:hypothetical protein
MLFFVKAFWGRGWGSNRSQSRRDLRAICPVRQRNSKFLGEVMMFKAGVNCRILGESHTPLRF